MSTTSLAAACALALAGSAHASISGTSGPIVQIPPPVGAFNPQGAFAWNEQAGVLLNNITVDLTAAQVSMNIGPSAPSVISGVFDSHFYHIGSHAGGPIVGTISFNNPIAAIIFDQAGLDATDASCGATGTIYPTFQPRSFTNLYLNGGIAISGYTATFVITPYDPLQPGMHTFQFRILTAVPTPGSAALPGLGALLAVRRRRR